MEQAALGRLESARSRVRKFGLGLSARVENSHLTRVVVEQPHRTYVVLPQILINTGTRSQSSNVL